MQKRRKVLVFIAAVLTVTSLLSLPAAAAGYESLILGSGSNLRATAPLIIGVAKVVTTPEIDSRVINKVSQTGLTVADIASRMYYLGYINGVSFDDFGKPVFNTDANLTRLDALIFALRLLELEDEATECTSECAFTDVPDWAKPYVAYASGEGLIEDGDDYFTPTSNADPDEFFSLMLYALGFDFETYSRENAQSNALAAGITETEKATLTRGDAICAMWSVLRSTMHESKLSYAELLCDSGAIDYNDATFFIWSEDNGEFAQYVDLMDYTMTETLADGYYAIECEATGSCLNVQTEGSNSDYEGVGVNLWKSTSDVTQIFRVERTEQGTYRIFSAASKGGYYRLVGFNYKRTGLSLWRDTSAYAEEYYIVRNYDDGESWFIIPASEQDTVLTAYETSKYNTSVAAAGKTDGDASQSWLFVSQSITTSNGEEAAVFPNDTLNITQGRFDTYSHGKQNAVDCVSRTRFFAPFTGRIVALGDGGYDCNVVWLESTSKVRYADGTVDYMTIAFLHDDDISDLFVGQVVVQGQSFIDAGVEGGATGEHTHIAVYRGRDIDTDVMTGSGDVDIEDALFVLHDTDIIDPYGYDWTIMP